MAGLAGPILWGQAQPPQAYGSGRAEASAGRRATSAEEVM